MEGRVSNNRVLALQKVCDLCKQSSCTDGEDVVLFGEWMTRSDITAHYYCLLLSTNLPQNGEDSGGILGFLLRDIRKEINCAKQRSCAYCGEKSATIKCHVCSRYFHLTCGQTFRCLYQFVGEFKSYCRTCIPLDEDEKNLLENPPDPVVNKCYICRGSMGQYYPYTWIAAKCCKNGYVHVGCLRKYALESGYYLKCIWCKKADFREDVKYYGVFVPDRDANWERENGFHDLNRCHMRCDMDPCHCENGREYNKGRKWKIIICKLCGLVGAHNPSCIPGMEHETNRVLEFKCDTCSATEHTIRDMKNYSQINADAAIDMGVNVSLYVNKGDNNNSAVSSKADVLDFSDSSMSSMDTVINKALLRYSVSPTNQLSPPQGPGPVLAMLLTQEQVPLEETETQRVLASSVVKVNLATDDNSYCMETIQENYQNSIQCEESKVETEAMEAMQNLSNDLISDASAAEVPIDSHVKNCEPCIKTIEKNYQNSIQCEESKVETEAMEAAMQNLSNDRINNASAAEVPIDSHVENCEPCDPGDNDYDFSEEDMIEVLVERVLAMMNV